MITTDLAPRITAYNKDKLMLMFRQKIQVSQRPNGQWILDTDRGDLYLLHQMKNTQERTIITDWFALNYPSELRRWQMDVLVKETTRMGYGDDFIIWCPYKKGQGFQQPHNIVIFYHMLHSMWILSTGDYHWFKESALTATEFNLDEACLANILDNEDRKNILYPITDQLNHRYR